MITFHNAPLLIKSERSLLVDWLSVSIAAYGFSAKSIDYSFLSIDEMIAKNKKHLNHDYLTDIITFNYSRGPRLEVDMLINIDFIADFAKAENLFLVDELDRVLIHGLLHCMGFEDKDEDKSKIMRIEEEKCLLLRPKKLKFRTIE